MSSQILCSRILLEGETAVQPPKLTAKLANSMHTIIHYVNSRVPAR